MADLNVAQQTEWMSKYYTDRPNMTGEKGKERPLKDNICYGEGRSVGARKAEKEGRKERAKRLIEKDSEMLTADSRQQGSETLQ